MWRTNRVNVIAIVLGLTGLAVWLASNPGDEPYSRDSAAPKHADTRAFPCLIDVLRCVDLDPRPFELRLTAEFCDPR